MTEIALFFGGLVLLYGLFRLFSKKKATDAEEIKDSVIGTVVYSKKHLSKTEFKRILAHLRDTRTYVWSMMERIYGVKTKYEINCVFLLPPGAMPPNHPLASLRGRNIKLAIGGGDSRSEGHWFAGEVHNHFRQQNRWPYRCTEEIHPERLAQCERVCAILKALA